MRFLKAVLVRAAPLLVAGCLLSDCCAQQRIMLFNSPGPVSLDGLLTEPCWQQAQVISDFRQRDPREGEPATERTEIRVVLYQKTLYIGVVAWDSNPGLIVAKEMRRDGAVEADDSITVILDTYLDHRNAFYFAFNPNGARRDALIVDEGVQLSPKGGTPSFENLNADWNAVWDVKAVITDKGWQAEVMIPLDTLRFAANQPLWGINFRRMIRRKSEEALWQAYRRNAGIFRISECGLLAGVPKFQQAHRYELRPYLSAAVTETPPPAAAQPSNMLRTHPVKVGADGKIKLTENLVADLTVNTDFAEAEVDQAVVNLTRFPVLFPEKRDFFLENAGFFDFLSPGRNRVFFSRRIGLSENGEPIPIAFGGRLTGKLGPFDLGFLNIQTRAQGATPAANYTTLRPKYGIFKKSYVGAIFTNVYNARDGNRNQALGLDGIFSFSSFFGQNLSVSSSIAQTSTQGLKGDRAAGSLGVLFPNDWLEAWFNYSFVQKNFNPEMGFLGRDSVEQYSAKWRFQPRPPAPWNKWIRQLYIKPLELDLYNTLPTRELESLKQEFRPLGATFQSGDSVEFNITRNFDRLDREFKIFKDVVIPQGRYWWNAYELSVETSSKRRWYLDKGQFSWGRYYNGEIKTINLSGNLRFTNHFSVGGSYAVNRARYQNDSFTAHEVASRVVYAFSNRANLQVFTQWNNDSRTASVYVRLHIIPKIGSDIYGVFLQLVDTSRLRRTNLGRVGRGKVVYPFYR